MDAEQVIASLDAALEQHADDPAATLQRLQGPNGAVLFAVTVRAWVRAYAPSQLSSAIIQGDSKVTISPTDLSPPFRLGESWPQGDAGALRRGDQIVIHGKARQVMASEPLHFPGSLERINFQVRG